MLELYHSPMTRSSRIVRLIDEMGIRDKVDINVVTIPRQDGSGGPDIRNPHPEKKVPLLVHDGEVIRESNAIMLYLTDLFPGTGLGRQIGEPGRGSYLSWLAYYGNVVEPVLIAKAAEVEHPYFHATFRGYQEMTDTLTAALRDKPYLLGQDYTCVDLLLSSPFTWFPDFTPDVPEIRDWVTRSNERPSVKRVAEFDAAAMAG